MAYPVLLALAWLTALTLSGCGSVTSEAPDPEPTGAPTPTASASSADESVTWHQTWAKDYAQTTCQEFRTAMTERQRFVAAADMLVNGKRAATGDEQLPADGEVRDCQNGLIGACEPTLMRDQPLADAATGMLLLMFPR